MLTMGPRLRPNPIASRPISFQLIPTHHMAPTMGKTPQCGCSPRRARHGTARQCTARHGNARHGTAMHGNARHGRCGSQLHGTDGPTARTGQSEPRRGLGVLLPPPPSPRCQHSSWDGAVPAAGGFSSSSPTKLRAPAPWEASRGAGRWQSPQRSAARPGAAPWAVQLLQLSAPVRSAAPRDAAPRCGAPCPAAARTPFFPSQHRGFAPPPPPIPPRLPPFSPLRLSPPCPPLPATFISLIPRLRSGLGSESSAGRRGGERAPHRTAPHAAPHPRAGSALPPLRQLPGWEAGGGWGGAGRGSAALRARDQLRRAPAVPPRSPRRGPRRRCGIGAARTAPPPRAQTALSDRMRLKTPPRGFSPCGRRRGSRIRQNLWTGDGEPQGRKERDARNYHPAKPFQHIAAIATEMGCPSRSLQCNKGRERDAGKERAVHCAGQFPKGLAQTNSNWKQLEPIPPLPL